VRRAQEALPAGGSVLDVGCGGGTAALALVPPAGRLVGVDPSPELLAAFASAAEAVGVAHQEVLGAWPQAAAHVLPADLVICHHVVYNVPDLAAFASALAGRTRGRVVLELTDRHALAWTNRMWQHFHGLDRPTGPTADLAAAVLAEAGIAATLELFTRPARPVPRDVLVAVTRRRLCLPAGRDAEVDKALSSEPPPSARSLACLWWDRQ